MRGWTMSAETPTEAALVQQAGLTPMLASAYAPSQYPLGP